MGIRMAYPHEALGWFDDKAALLSMGTPPIEQAPDLSYACVRWHLPIASLRAVARIPRSNVYAPTVFPYEPGKDAQITLEYTVNGSLLEGRYTSDVPVPMALFVNGCFAPAHVKSVGAASCLLTQGAQELLVTLRGQIQPALLADSRDEAETVWHQQRASGGSALAIFPVNLALREPLYFSMRLSPTGADEPLPCLPEEIALRLSNGEAGYRKSRMTSSGTMDHAAEAVADLSAYSRTYDPERERLQTTVNRTWGSPGMPGLIFGWDNFFTSYTAASEDPVLAAASLEHIVKVYGEKGIAHGPVQRNLIIPTIYCRTLTVLNDEALARRTWPVMMDFMRFWFADRGDGRARRDGNNDGLIEPGCSHPKDSKLLGHLISDAMDETGYDDLPVYSAGFTHGRRGCWPTVSRLILKPDCLTSPCSAKTPSTSPRRWPWPPGPDGSDTTTMPSG